MEEKLIPLLNQLPKWQHTILEYLLRTEEEYVIYMEQYYNQPLSKSSPFEKFEKVYTAMQEYRLARIEKLSISYEDFENLYDEDPYIGLTTLFQHGIPMSYLKLAKEKISAKKHTLKKYYECNQINPEEFFHQIVTSRLDEEDMMWKKKWHSQKREQYEKQNNVTTEILNGTAETNQRTTIILLRRRIRDSQMARNIKSNYEGTCQLCNSNLKSRDRYITEAHHIRPFNEEHKGQDSYNNLIVLCPNCHTRFDDSYFAIHPETNIVHCLDTSNELHLSALSLMKGHELGKDNLEYAWKIFDYHKKNYH